MRLIVVTASVLTAAEMVLLPITPSEAAPSDCCNYFALRLTPLFKAASITE